MANHLFDGTGELIRLIVRRDRIRIAAWLLGFALMTLATAAAFTDLYQNAAERQALAETMKNPAMTAMVGPGFGLANYTNGAMMAHQMLLMTAVVVGLMSVLLVTRNTRAEEEDGRTEMIRSLPVGRLSGLQSTLWVMLAVNVLLTLIIGFGLYALGIEGMDLEGSLLYGAALGSTGFVFAAITAVFAQLSQSSRGTLGWSVAVLVLAYLIRGIGDVGNEVLSWFSPLGWAVRSEVYVNNYWWPVLLTIGVALAISGLALYLNSIRDLGSGFFTARTGRTHASPAMLSPFGLAFRMQRTGIIAWAIGMFVLGASYGSVLGDLEAFFADVDLMQELLVVQEGFTLVEQFLPILMSVLAIIAAIPSLLAFLKLKSEEKNGRIEHILGRAVSRTRLMGSYLVLAFLISIVMTSMAGLGMGIVGNSLMDETLPLSTFYYAAIVYLPAIWAMIGLSALLMGWFKSLTGFVWLYLAFSFVVVYMGSLFQFPEWVVQVSPFGHIPQWPIEEMDIGAAAVLAGIAILLAIAGVVGYNKRDIGL